MYRFTPVFGMALLWLAGPAHPKDKPKPPAIDVDNRGAIKRWEGIHGKRERWRSA